MINTILFYAKIYMIFTLDSIGINWRNLASMLLVLIVGSMLVVVMNALIAKKAILYIHHEHGAEVADKFVERMKKKLWHILGYALFIVFLGGGIFFLIVLPGCPIYICLLYTSPSPRDQRGSRMPSSA